MVDREIKKIQEGKFSNEKFDWNSHEIELDSNDLKTTDIENENYDTIYLTLLLTIRNIFGFAVAIRLYRYIFGNTEYSLKGSNLNDILNITIIYLGIFLILSLILQAGNIILTVANFNETVDKYQSISRLSVILVWLLIAFINSQIVKKEATFIYDFFKKIIKAAIITTIAFMIVSYLMIRFEDFFIKKSLKSKIRETEKTEKILRHMIRFRYGSLINESSSSIESPTYGDVICIDLLGFNRSIPEPVDIDNERKYGTITIKPPALQNIKDCLNLAKECFYKAADGQENLQFDHFAKMFNNTKQALSAFAYFDSDQDRSISKKEFRDTTVYFFRDREVLEKSIKSTKEFVHIIKSIISVIAGLFLGVVYLMIFGVSFKELIAVLLSSALAFNFVASGLLAETYRNIVMLLSHQFDIGDDVIVDGQDLKVFKMGLSSTSFINVHGGKLKYLNSDLWKQTIINMTKAPEKILVFSFKLPSTVTPSEIGEFKARIHSFLIKKIFDYHDNFQLISKSSGSTGISNLECSIVLQCKGYKNKSKKFLLRVEFTSFLQEVLKELNFKIE